jgi:hypothetical protein
VAVGKAAWQNRPHDGLRDPLHPGRAFTPNEKYAAMVEAVGYVPVALSADDYVELLPARWHAVNAYGIKVSRRTYDGEELNPFRQQPSGVKEHGDRWEVHCDPYDISRIWVRDHWNGGWVTVFWTQLHRVAAPFGEMAWDHVRARQPGATEEELADAVDSLLRRASQGPGGAGRPGQDRRGRRVAARTKAAQRLPRAAARPGGNDGQPQAGSQDDDGLAEIIPMPIFDPLRRGGQTVVSPGPGEEDRQPRALTTLAGWRQFAGEVPTVPQLLDPVVWQGLDAGKRAAYDDDRIAHHLRLLIVQTPAVRDVVTTGRRLAHMNRSARYGRSGLIVSGPARTGKTTAITQLGKTIEVIHRRRYPRCGDDIPVAYITVPPATPRMIAAEFARFLGIPVTQRANITDIIEAVCGACADARTSVVCVDEIHNLNIATRAGGEASDTLKYFSERIPATFVLAGISVERAGLLSGPRGEQIAGRYSMVRTGPFPRDGQWATLIAALEGILPRLASYLHERAGGMIGSLLWLIRSAAIQAVIDGTEQVTRKAMDAIPVDIASQTASRAEHRERS